MDKSGIASDVYYEDGVSVVVPTYNNSFLLRLTLDSLCSQVLDRGKYEVIVVDDGSADDSKSIALSYLDKLNFKYFYQEDFGYRVSAARNVGLNNVKYKTTLFFDAGMVASPDLLNEHYKEHKKNTNTVLLGLSYGVEEYDNNNEDILLSILSLGDLVKVFHEMSLRTELYDCRYEYMKSINFDFENMGIPWILFWTGHVSCATSLLKEVGGFDEWFSSWGGEDVELGLRLYQAGAKYKLLPKQESIHCPHDKDSEKKRTDSQKNIQYIHAKHNIEETLLMKKHGWRELVEMYTAILS